MKQKFKVYEYPLPDCIGSYTIRSEVKPLGLEGEKLVQEFEYETDGKRLEPNI